MLPTHFLLVKLLFQSMIVIFVRLNSFEIKTFDQKTSASHRKVNRLCIGKVYIASSKKPSHFMDAESTLEMWSMLYEPAYRLRRKLLGLNFKVVGCLDTDGFTGNTAFLNGEAVRRKRLLDNMNCVQGIKRDAGWSAHGSVCDFVHAQLRHYQASDVCVCCANSRSSMFLFFLHGLP